MLIPDDDDGSTPLPMHEGTRPSCATVDRGSR